MAFNIPTGPRASRGTMRWLLRQKKATDFALRSRDGGGEREKARRVRNMVRETLRAENGVVQQFEEPEHTYLLCACGLETRVRCAEIGCPDAKESNQPIREGQ